METFFEFIKIHLTEADDQLLIICTKNAKRD